ncbi:MAG: hypothetical protein NT116_03345 [Candidatus Parcubacteria bacterium]|nr:hypothetical protein [Candidatus Parcubacteria bacterium]
MNSDKKFQNAIKLIIRDLFVASFLLLVIFSFLEIIKPKIILNYLNFNVFFLAILILGVITILYFEPEPKEVKKLNFLDYSAIILFSILVGIFCFYLTRGIGWLSVLVGIASIIICYLFITTDYR